jgi:hypothetical protein
MGVYIEEAAHNIRELPSLLDSTCLRKLRLNLFLVLKMFYTHTLPVRQNLHATHHLSVSTFGKELYQRGSPSSQCILQFYHHAPRFDILSIL